MEEKQKRGARLLVLLRHAGIVIGLTFLLALGYMLAVYYRAGFVFWIYYAALAASAIGYVVSNRGFSRTRVLREELPATWSEEEKDAFFADAEARKRGSLPLLYLTVSLALTFLYDMFFLFLAEPLAEIFPFLGDLL